MIRRGVAIALILLSAAACSRGSGDEDAGPQSTVAPPPNLLDGRPRVADDAGQATEITDRWITLDGERTYPLSTNVVAFSTYTAETGEPMRRTGQYVQVGVDSEVVVWIAGFGAVLEAGGQRITTFTGRVESTNDRQVVFSGGTVLTLGPEVEAPPVGAVVDVDIDVDANTVVALRVRGTSTPP